MLKLLLGLVALLLSSSTEAATPASAQMTTTRSLEDADELEGYYFRFDKCVRVKIVEDNDEDEDGNSYFYNGAYRSQSTAYASFYRCEKGCDDTCDTSTAYVTDLNTALQYSVGYSQGYCNACAQQCRRRRLEDEEEEEEEVQYTLDCKTCSNQCKTLNNGGNQGNDETEYMDCQAAFVDDNGLQYYSAPACASNGALTIGLFYDEDCTIKNAGDNTGFEENFAYNSFKTVQNLCMNCDGGICNDISEDGDAVKCVDGKSVDGDDDMKVCKTYKRASKEWEYAKKKKKSKVPLVLFGFLFLSIASFLSYSYFIRHRNQPDGKTALLEEDAAPRQPRAELL